MAAQAPGVDVLSWNVHEAAADSDRAATMIRFVESTLPGVALLHSVYWTRKHPGAPLRDEDSPVLAWSIERFADQGYHVTWADEKDPSERPDRTGSLLLVHADLGPRGRLVEAPGVRRVFEARVRDSETGVLVSVGGAHYTDETEELRLEQVAALPQLDVSLTDANAMYRSSGAARFFRALGHTPLSRIYENRDFNNAHGFDVVRMYRHWLGSLAGMADGRTMEQLKEQHGLVDADPRRRPTIHKGPFGIAQLDHIHYNPQTVTTSNFQVHRKVDGSDHWPISATVRPVASRPGRHARS